MERCLLDLGNTRYKWIGNGDLSEHSPNQRLYAEENPAVELVDQIFESNDLRYWSVSSVRSDAFNLSVKERFLARGGKAIRFISLPEETPFRLAYHRPEQFGIDRYLDLLAARALYGWPLIIVDAGTAVTIDALDAQGDHAGGVILPGLDLMRRSLGQGTDRIAENADAPQRLFGESTAECVSGGIWFGLRSAIQGIVDEMRTTIGAVPVVLTGGDAAMVANGLDNVIYDETLLLKGIDRA